MPSFAWPPTKFTNEEQAVLLAIAEGFYPPLQPSADAPGAEYKRLQVRGHPSTMAYVAYRLERALPPFQIRALCWIFYLLQSSAGTFALSAGCFARPFLSLSPLERMRVLCGWAQSPVTQLRVVCRILFKFTSMALFGKCISHSLESSAAANGNSGAVTTTLADNPFWKHMGYRRFPEGDRKAHVPAPGIRLLELPELAPKPEYDIVIVGSGAGAGVAAQVLSEAGYRVLVCEKGRQWESKKLPLVEEDAYRELFEQEGLVPSEDGSIGIMAGSTFGGGTAINWSASLQTPHYVREEWANVHGLQHFRSPAFQDSLDRVCKRIGATTEHVVHNIPNQILMEGCRKLGYPVATVPQNSAGHPHACGYCHLGCPLNIKQGSHQTFHKDAAKNGAQFLCDCYVEKIIREAGGNAVGVEARVGGRRITIQCSLVVVAGGSLHTPALLLRSGFKNANIGKHLRLHPVTIAFGYFPGRDTKSSEGSILTTISPVVDDTGDGKHYGCKLEVPTSHPMLAGATFPFLAPFSRVLEEAAAESRVLVEKFPHISPIIVLQRDRDSQGNVAINDQGHPVVQYQLSQHDGKSMTRGLDHAFHVFIAEGATELYSSLDNLPPYRFQPATQAEKPTITDPGFVTFLQKLHEVGVQAPHNTTVFSAHQMGSCRLATSPSHGPCKPTGQLWECENVWVCDGSLFPTSSGVNPMVTILAVADHAAKECVKYCDATFKNREL